MSKDGRMSKRAFALTMARGMRDGTRRPPYDWQARVSLGLWASVSVLSACTLVGGLIAGSGLGFGFWWRLTTLCIDVVMLTFAVQGILYRRELRAKQREQIEFLQTIAGGYGFKLTVHKVKKAR